MSEDYTDADELSVRAIENLAGLMDSRFTLPGTNISLGLDTIIGLIPGIGDTIGLGVSGYIIARSAKLGVPKRKLARMGMNSGIDWAIGTIPLIGDIFDVGWKANNRNAAILRKHHNKVQGKRRKSSDPVTIDPNEKFI